MKKIVMILTLLSIQFTVFSQARFSMDTGIEKLGSLAIDSEGDFYGVQRLEKSRKIWKISKSGEKEALPIDLQTKGIIRIFIDYKDRLFIFNREEQSVRLMKLDGKPQLRFGPFKDAINMVLGPKGNRYVGSQAARGRDYYIWEITEKNTVRQFAAKFARNNVWSFFVTSANEVYFVDRSKKQVKKRIASQKEIPILDVNRWGRYSWIMLDNFENYYLWSGESRNVVQFAGDGKYLEHSFDLEELNAIAFDRNNDLYGIKNRTTIFLLKSWDELKQAWMDKHASPLKETPLVVRGNDDPETSGAQSSGIAIVAGARISGDYYNGRVLPHNSKKLALTHAGKGGGTAVATYGDFVAVSNQYYPSGTTVFQKRGGEWEEKYRIERGKVYDFPDFRVNVEKLRSDTKSYERVDFTNQSLLLDDRFMIISSAKGSHLFNKSEEKWSLATSLRDMINSQQTFTRAFQADKYLIMGTDYKSVTLAKREGEFWKAVGTARDNDTVVKTTVLRRTSGFDERPRPVTIEHPVYDLYNFGYSTATNGVDWFVAAPLARESGQVYIYNQFSDGKWTLSDTLRPIPRDSTVGFGISIDVEENDLLVGVGKPKASVKAPEGFALHAFRKVANKWGARDRIFIPLKQLADNIDERNYSIHSKIDIEGIYAAVSVCVNERRTTKPANAFGPDRNLTLDSEEIGRVMALHHRVFVFKNTPAGWQAIDVFKTGRMKFEGIEEMKGSDFVLSSAHGDIYNAYGFSIDLNTDGFVAIGLPADYVVGKSTDVMGKEKDVLRKQGSAIVWRFDK